MSIFSDISDQWQIADEAFGALEHAAYAANDDPGYDAAGQQRKRNDQAYFLFLFTRFEDAVNEALDQIIKYLVSGVAWSDRRIWTAWSGKGTDKIHFLSRIEVLIDKSTHPYAHVKEYYDGRNEIAHGGVWAEQFVIPNIAIAMEKIIASFPAA
jgi:hypothetical protein